MVMKGKHDQENMEKAVGDEEVRKKEVQAPLVLQPKTPKRKL